MKILFVTMALGIGGAETHVVELSRALAAMGHDVTVASAGGVYVAPLEEAGVRHVTLPLATKRPGAVLAAKSGLTSLILGGRFDVVHGHARIPNFILSRVRKKVPFRFAATAHLDFAVNAIWRRLSKWGERTIAVSEDIKAYLIREYGVSADSIDVTINGVDMDKFSPDVDFSDVLGEFSLDPSHRRLVYISRIDPDRSAPAFLLTERAAALAADYGDLDIVIVGGGSDLDRLRAEADAANAAAGRKIVTLTGARSDINKFCAAADVFVGVSRSAFEAMSCAAPVILAGNQGYLGTFTESVFETAAATNFCCRGAALPDADVLERDVRALLDMSADERRALGGYCRSVIAEHYSAERMARDYLACWAKMGIGR